MSHVDTEHNKLTLREKFWVYNAGIYGTLGSFIFTAGIVADSVVESGLVSDLGVVAWAVGIAASVSGIIPALDRTLGSPPENLSYEDRKREAILSRPLRRRKKKRKKVVSLIAQNGDVIVARVGHHTVPNAPFPLGLAHRTSPHDRGYNPVQEYDCFNPENVNEIVEYKSKLENRGMLALDNPKLIEAKALVKTLNK